jgi:hypothetical protein
MRNPTAATLAISALLLGLMGAGSPSPATAREIGRAHAAKRPPSTASVQPPPETVTRMADWVIASGDHSDLPFVIIDKVAARIFVFRADGRLRGAAPALLGYARGDNSTPGVGDREMSAIRPADRTTPAGRFVASFGRGPGGRRVLWVDYATAISLHPVVTAHPAERRPQRLQSPTPRDNRITYGCINVPPAFYEKVVRRTFTGSNGIVYILPEKKPLDQVFPAFAIAENAAPTGDRKEAREILRASDSGSSNAASSGTSDNALAR